MSPPTDAQNQAALDHFILLPVSSSMIAHLASKASQVIRCGSTPARSERADRQAPLTPPSTPPLDASDAEPALPSLELFIQSLVDRSHVQVPTLMSSLVYLARLQSRLPPVAKGMRCTVHRIFLASLILAAKNLNDSSPKNKHWARYSAVRGYSDFGFSVTEVNLMERQLLFLLDWDLRIEPAHLYTHLDPFLAPIRAHHLARDERRAAATASALRASSTAPAVDTPLPYHPALYTSTFMPPTRPTRPEHSLSHSRSILDDRARSQTVNSRSISPPALDAVPGLSHAAATPSSRASSISPPPHSRRAHTPASSIDSALDVVVLGSGLSETAGKSWNAYSLEMVGADDSISKAALHGQYAEERAVKKAKGTSGKLISRFLGASVGERRTGRGGSVGF